MSVKKGSRYSIKSVIIITVSLLLVASVAATLLIGNRFESRVKEAQSERYISNMKLMEKSLNSRLSEVYYDLKRLCENDSVKGFLSNDFLNYNQVRQECTERLFKNSYIESVVFMASNGERQFFSQNGHEQISTLVLSEIVEHIDSFAPMGVVGMDKKSFVMALPVFDSQYSETIGTVTILLSSNMFYDEFRFFQKEGFAAFVAAQDTLPIKTTIVTDYIKLPENWLAQNREQKERSFNPFEVEGEDYYASYFLLENYGIIVYCIIPSQALGVGLPVYLWASIALLGAVLVFVFAMIIRLFVLMEDSFKSVDGLLEDIESFDKKRLEGLFSVEEFYYIANRVCEVSDKIAQLNYEKLSAQKSALQKEIAKRNAMLIAFKNQINPHFVYNTLASIKQFNAGGRSEPVAEICDRMVGILRYSVKSSTTAKVYEEIEALESYLFIQNLRFSQGISYRIDVDEQLLECDMLRFLLQPIIENSIMHGILSENVSGKITVSGSIEGEKIVFRLSDSGVGMSKEALKSLKQKLSSRVDITSSTDESGRGIGLANINNRIKLYYGDEYGLKISSILNVGTFVTVEFPINIKEGS